MTAVRRWSIAALAMAACVGGWPHAAAAQVRPQSGLVEPRVVIMGAGGWTGGSDLGSGTATLTGNGVPTGTPTTFFEVDSRVDGGPRVEGRIAVRLTRALSVEGGLAVTYTHLRTSVSGDVEQAPSIDATARFTEYAIEGGLVVKLRRLSFGGGRGQPFVTGGAGYLRQLHDGATLIDTGQIVFGGGGFTYALKQATRPAFLKTIGLRATARIDVRTGGFEIEADGGEGSGGTRVSPSVSAGLFVGF